MFGRNSELRNDSWFLSLRVSNWARWSAQFDQSAPSKSDNLLAFFTWCLGLFLSTALSAQPGRARPNSDRSNVGSGERWVSGERTRSGSKVKDRSKLRQ